MTIKILCVVALLIGAAERVRLAAIIRPVVTLPLPRPDKIGAVR